ncbi:DUF2971 domain-containing protein [Rhizobium calliandrae]|uniref:DUF2971 domain-containing protein n=1 Tax=Rhizobium calliandrae TaxID=1312182 RepID=A0ABT7KMY1_9HYPH|nr:DUF2971 domain-containing protein [Rhizobium calliandrae]MDL2409975.1 DUF2971 domain-containing protein [Rhizobium calliandrae]
MQPNPYPGLDANQIALMQLFHPHAFRRMANALNTNMRFVHYTSADTALKIIANEEVWMRKSTCMNDFNEIEHGFSCLRLAYAEHKERFTALIEPSFPEFSKKLEDHFNGWLPSIRNSTYISCISEHENSEDLNGRLSMWRAYGGPTGVAIVVRSEPFLRPSDALQAYTSPVAYLSEAQFSIEFANTLDGFEQNFALIVQLSEEQLLGHMFEVFRMAVLCTKHPGFAEEKEWRIVYSPSMYESTRIKPDIFTFNGVPQKIFKIPLKSVESEGLVGIEVAQLIDRIIIGPTSFPVEIKEALGTVLQTRGIENPYGMIWMSEIPLRN